MKNKRPLLVCLCLGMVLYMFKLKYFPQKHPGSALILKIPSNAKESSTFSSILKAPTMMEEDHSKRMAKIKAQQIHQQIDVNNHANTKSAKATASKPDVNNHANSKSAKATASKPDVNNHANSKSAKATASTPDPHAEPKKCKTPIIAVTRLNSNNIQSINSFTHHPLSKNLPLIVVITNPQDFNLVSKLSRVPNVMKCWSLSYMKAIHVQKIKTILLNWNSTLPCNSSTFVLPHNKSAEAHSATLHNAGNHLAILLGACSVWEFEGAMFSTMRNFFQTGHHKEKPLSLYTVYSHSSLTVNAYVLFNAKYTNSSEKVRNHKIMQPRGLPLRDTKTIVVPTVYATNLINEPAAILNKFETGILHTPLHDWPDINAENEVTCKRKLHFQPTIPDFNIHPSQFAPVNGKATLFFESTLWALFRPPSLPIKMADIYRGYIAQTIMRCTGHVLKMSKPFSASTIPCGVNYSLTDEDQMQIEKLIEHLIKFNCKLKKGESHTVPVCLMKLYMDLQGQNLLEHSDIQQLGKWLEGVQEVYKFPSINSSICIESSQEDQSYFKLSIPYHPEQSLNNTNLRRHSLPASSQALLIIHITHCHIEVIPIWLAVYQYLVPKNVVFYSSGCSYCFSFAAANLICSVSNDTGGLTMYESMMDAMERWPNYGMYIQHHEDISFNPLGYESITRGGQGAIYHEIDPRKQSYFCINQSNTGMTFETRSTKDASLRFKLGATLIDMYKAKVLLPLMMKYSKYCPADKRTKYNYTTVAKGAQSTCVFGISPVYDSIAVAAKDKQKFLEVMKPFKKFRGYLELVVPYVQTCVLGYGLLDTTKIKVNFDYSDTALWSKIQNKHYCSVMTSSAKSLQMFGNSRQYPQGTDLHVCHSLKPSYELLRILTWRDCFLKPFY